MNKKEPLSPIVKNSLLKIIIFIEDLIANIDNIGISMPDKSGVEILARDKAIAEIALFLTELYQHPSTDKLIKQQCIAAIENLLVVCDFDRIKSIIYRCPQAALAFGTLAIALKAIDQKNNSFYKMLESAIDSPFYLSTSRPEFREFEALWLAGRIKDKSISDVFSETPRTGILFRFTHANFLRREDMYAKTHMAMYLTDFGRHRIKGSFDKKLISCSLDHDLAWAFGCADWDLVGELSMAALYCLDDAPSLWQTSCHKALDAVFHQFGCIPMPTYDENYSKTLTKENSRLYLVFHAYHTTIVYGLLLLAQSGCVKFNAVQYDDISSCDILFSKALSSGNFILPGSGLDKNWFDADQMQYLNFRNDFLAEVVLSKIFEDHGIDKSIEMALLINDAKEGSVLRETIDMLVMHKSIFSAENNFELRKFHDRNNDHDPRAAHAPT
ncbi:DUF6895 family protein [Simplicispira psychrophila]|uniref:DUF6895 family protein n=1 Tax=Simplicispira psychrophila TaxID=80882 RepID=UPI000AC70594|nr:hypothetical protein [Simplicispira psychrophila]